MANMCSQALEMAPAPFTSASWSDPQEPDSPSFNHADNYPDASVPSIHESSSSDNSISSWGSSPGNATADEDTTTCQQMSAMDQLLAFISFLQSQAAGSKQMATCAVAAADQMRRALEATQLELAGERQQRQKAEAELCLQQQHIDTLQGKLGQAVRQEQKCLDMATKLRRELHAIVPKDLHQRAAMLQRTLLGGAAGSGLTDAGVDAAIDRSSPDVEPLMKGHVTAPGAPILLQAHGMAVKAIQFKIAGNPSGISSDNDGCSTSGRAGPNLVRTFNLASTEPRFYGIISQQAPDMQLVPRLHALGVRPCTDGGDSETMQLVMVMEKGVGDVADCLYDDVKVCLRTYRIPGSTSPRSVGWDKLRSSVASAVAWYAHGILYVVSAINGMKIIMDDIKPEQFIVSADDGSGSRVQAIDLEGLRYAVAYHPQYGWYVDGSHGFASHGYLAPERSNSPASRSSEKSDAYAVAVTLRNLHETARGQLQSASLPDCAERDAMLEAFDRDMAPLDALCAEGTFDDATARPTVRKMMAKYGSALLAMC